MKYLAKIADAEIMWQDKASRIRSGQQKSMLTILEERGLIQTVTGYVSICPSCNVKRHLIL